MIKKNYYLMSPMHLIKLTWAALDEKKSYGIIFDSKPLI